MTIKTGHGYYSSFYELKHVYFTCGIPATGYSVRLRSNNQLLRRFSSYQRKVQCKWYSNNGYGDNHDIMCKLHHDIRDAARDAFEYAVKVDKIIDIYNQPYEDIEFGI